jgi:hypothetical protein
MNGILKDMDHPEFTDWLISARTASIRYRTLVDLLDFPGEDADVVQARHEIMIGGAVPAILSHQTEMGNWEGERSFYTPKYFSTHWSLMLLTELDVDGSDPRFRQGVRYMLETTAEDIDKRLHTRSFGWSCFWGNLLRSALHAGMGEDAQVENVIHFATLALQNGPCRCEHNWDRECAWGAARSLWGLAAIPKAQRRPETVEAIAQGAKFLLDSFPLLEADHPEQENGGANPIWFKLNFPLFYQADILFCLRVLDELEMLDQPDAQAALEWLEGLRDRNGRWPGSSPYRQRTWRELGDREETNRWVSLQASRILLHAGRIPAFNKPA